MMMNILQEALQRRKRPINLAAARYLKEVMDDYQPDHRPFVYLPSLRRLMDELDCPEAELRQALISVEARGFKYLMLHRESPIALWKPQPD